MVRIKVPLLVLLSLLQLFLGLLHDGLHLCGNLISPHVLPSTHKDINRQAWELPKGPQRWWCTSALSIGRIQPKFQSPYDLAPMIRWEAVLSQHAPDCLPNGAVGSLCLSISLGVVIRGEHCTLSYLVPQLAPEISSKMGIPVMQDFIW